MPADRKPNFQRPRTEAGAHLWPWPRWFLCSQIFLLLLLDQLLVQVHVCNVVVLDNPSHFKNPFQFEITFECIEVRSSKSTKRFYFWSLDQDLPEDLEWKIIYVGSAESEEYDQVIDQQLQFYDFPQFQGTRYCVCRACARGKTHVRLPGILNSCWPCDVACTSHLHKRWLNKKSLEHLTPRRTHQTLIRYQKQT